MDDGDEWGPWDPPKRSTVRLPLPTLRLRPTPKKTVFQRLSTGRYGRYSEQKSPYPARAICLMDCFKNSIEPTRTRLRGRQLKTLRVATACAEKSAGQPDLRTSIQIKSLLRARDDLARGYLLSAGMRFTSPQVFSLSYSPVSLPLTQRGGDESKGPPDPSPFRVQVECTSARFRHSSIC